MVMKFEDVLANDFDINRRRELANNRIQEIKKEFSHRLDLQKYDFISIYCGGSLGRGDVGEKTDLDLFILTNRKSRDEHRLESLRLLSEIIDINNKLGFPEFSNDGEYLKVYSFPDMLEALGSPKDDNENLFTVRMLLILESRPIFNEDLYNKHITRVLDHYFRDRRGRRSFKPLFLLNDLLRFWRTLCLNYELIRDDPDRPWRKKNINLKFSRMITVFGTVLPIIVKPASTQEDVIELVKLTPIVRLALGLDMIGDYSLLETFRKFISDYEVFLKIKEEMGSKLSLDDSSLDRKTREMAKDFSGFLFKCLTHKSINHDFVKYLIL
jgi:hypothetical protein